MDPSGNEGTVGSLCQQVSWVKIINGGRQLKAHPNCLQYVFCGTMRSLCMRSAVEIKIRFWWYLFLNISLVLFGVSVITRYIRKRFSLILAIVVKPVVKARDFEYLHAYVLRDVILSQSLYYVRKSIPKITLDFVLTFCMTNKKN